MSYTGQTLDAFIPINVSGLLLLPTNGPHRTGLETQAAHLALFHVHHETN